MTTPIAAGRVGLIAEAKRLLGRSLVVEPVQGFVGNETFRLTTTAGERYYLKSGVAPAIEAEVRACELARGVGVPAPEIVATGTDPAAYLIQREVPGQPGDTSVIAAAGDHLRRLHTIIGSTGFGFLHDGLHPTWPEAVHHQLDGLDALVASDVLPASLHRQLDQVVTAAWARLDPTPPTLLHGDLHPRHIYAAHGKLTGIIDFGDAAFGDPLFDLGRFSHAGPAATAALLNGYGLASTPSVEWALTFYRAVWSAMALRWEFIAGGDWFDVHRDTLETLLPRLS